MTPRDICDRWFLERKIIKIDVGFALDPFFYYILVNTYRQRAALDCLKNVQWKKDINVRFLASLLHTTYSNKREQHPLPISGVSGNFFCIKKVFVWVLTRNWFNLKFRQKSTKKYWQAIRWHQKMSQVWC